MRIRPYISCVDYDVIKSWDLDERIHAMWCASLIEYPLEKKSFEEVLEKDGEDYGESPFVATDDDGKVIGFFAYYSDLETNEGMIKFVMLDPDLRDNGLGKELIQLITKYAFEIAGVDSVQLDAFPENLRAINCYKGAGFKERLTEYNVFSFKDELWGRCNMAMSKNQKDG